MSDSGAALQRGASVTAAADEAEGSDGSGEKNDLGNGDAGFRREEGVRRSGRCAWGWSVEGASQSDESLSLTSAGMLGGP